MQHTNFEKMQIFSLGAQRYPLLWNYVITAAFLMPKKYEATGYIVSDNEFFNTFILNKDSLLDITHAGQALKILCNRKYFLRLLTSI